MPTRRGICHGLVNAEAAMLLLSRNYDSLRILIYLCGKSGYGSTTRELSEALCLSLSASRRQVWQLRDAGLVTGSRGYAGGVMLAAPPENISIGKVVAAIEAQRRQANELDPECKQIFEQATVSFFATLDRMTVRDVCPTCQSCESAERSQQWDSRSAMSPTRKLTEPKAT